MNFELDQGNIDDKRISLERISCLINRYSQLSNNPDENVNELVECLFEMSKFLEILLDQSIFTSLTNLEQTSNSFLVRDTAFKFKYLMSYLKIMQLNLKKSDKEFIKYLRREHFAYISSGLKAVGFETLQIRENIEDSRLKSV